MSNPSVGLLLLFVLLMNHSQSVSWYRNAGDEPVFTFDYPDTIYICEVDEYELEVTDGQPNYRYQWYRNGVALPDDTLSAFTVQISGDYQVRVSDGDDDVLSDIVRVRKVGLEKPTSTSPGGTICEGTSRRLTLTGKGDGVTVQWFRNGQALAGETDTMLFVNEAGAYHIELYVGSCSVASDAFNLSVAELPIASIHVADESPLCHGTYTTLTANHSDDDTYTYLWSTGETTRSIEVDVAGEYRLILTNAAGCADTASVTVAFREPPLTPYIPDTMMCLRESGPLQLLAPGGYVAYEWVGVDGAGQEVEITAPGTYTLRVQDENGCWAATSFVVRQSCAEVNIPNMFSPNGDGRNDTWEISGLEYDQQMEVFVVDRNGMEVFRSRGYATPWNGTFRGKLVPVGAYFYSIRMTSGEHYKGALTILY